MSNNKVKCRVCQQQIRVEKYAEDNLCTICIDVELSAIRLMNHHPKAALGLLRHLLAQASKQIPLEKLYVFSDTPVKIQGERKHLATYQQHINKKYNELREAVEQLGNCTAKMLLVQYLDGIEAVMQSKHNPEDWR